MYVTCTKRHRLPASRWFLCLCQNLSKETFVKPFSRAAPVGNSNPYLNLERLAAGGLSSLKGNKALLTPSLPLIITGCLS